jgi:hypothetical protein
MPMRWKTRLTHWRVPRIFSERYQGGSCVCPTPIRIQYSNLSENINVTLRLGILQASDRLLTAATATALLGSVLAFGGAVWWYRPAAVAVTLVLVTMQLLKQALEGRIRVFRSPLTLLWLLVLAIAAVQLGPMPAFVARRIAPASHDIYVYGTMPSLAKADDAAVRLQGPTEIRTPATLDRPATLRWLLGAAICLGVFWSVSHFADRLRRLYLVWGLIAAGFMLEAAFAVVQISGQADGIYGVIGSSHPVGWGPSADELADAPGAAMLRSFDPPATIEKPSAFQSLGWAPRNSFLFGVTPGGSSAFLALGAMALPLSLGIVLHLIAPRGSRESLAWRLGPGGQGSLATLLIVMLVISAFVAGMTAGPWFCIPFAATLCLVGIISSTSPGTRAVSLGLTAVVVASLGLGVALVSAWPVLLGTQPPIAPLSWPSARAVWDQSWAIVRDFPLLGVGFGSFPVIYPYYKSEDLAVNNAMSSVLQSGIEGGVLMYLILAVAGLWCLWRLPSCVTKVGSADRALVSGLVGAVFGFTVWSMMNWTVELPAVAVCASALCGTWNRWLAGATDLFVERV